MACSLTLDSICPLLPIYFQDKRCSRKYILRKLGEPFCTHLISYLSTLPIEKIKAPHVTIDLSLLCRKLTRQDVKAVINTIRKRWILFTALCKAAVHYTSAVDRLNTENRQNMVLALARSFAEDFAAHKVSFLNVHHIFGIASDVRTVSLEQEGKTRCLVGLVEKATSVDVTKIVSIWMCECVSCGNSYLIPTDLTLCPWCGKSAEVQRLAQASIIARSYQSEAVLCSYPGGAHSTVAKIRCRSSAASPMNQHIGLLVVVCGSDVVPSAQASFPHSATRTKASLFNHHSSKSSNDASVTLDCEQFEQITFEEANMFLLDVRKIERSVSRPARETIVNRLYWSCPWRSHMSKRAAILLLLVLVGAKARPLSVLLTGQAGARTHEALNKLSGAAVYVHTASGTSLKTENVAPVLHEEEQTSAGVALSAGSGLLVIPNLSEMSVQDENSLRQLLISQKVQCGPPENRQFFPAACAVAASCYPKCGRFEPNVPIERSLGPKPSPATVRAFSFVLLTDADARKGGRSELGENGHSLLTMIGEETEPLPQDLVQRYIAYAKTCVSPKLSAEAAQAIGLYYVQCRTDTRNASEGELMQTRQHTVYTLMSLDTAEACARLQLEEVVREQHAQAAIDLHRGLQQELVDLQHPCTQRVNINPGSGRTKKSRVFWKAAHTFVQQTGRDLLSQNDLCDIARGCNLVMEDLSAFLSYLNDSGVLLKRGSGLFQLRGDVAV